MAAPAPAIRLTNVSKTFGGARALDAVDFEVAAGEVHALLGQNGCGKSTLVKILTGYHAPDPGARCELWGEPVGLPVTAASERGIAVIHQDLGLVEEMTVLENFGVMSGYGTKLLLPIHRRGERRICQELLDEVGLSVALDAPLRELSPAQRAGVAIARARRALREHGTRHLLIVDEPTTYLGAEEANQMLDLLRAVAATGSSVVFVTHRLHEVLAVADSVTVLRDGRVADRLSGADATRERILSAMLGRALEQFYPDPVATASTKTRVRVDALSGETLRDVSFEVGHGEILGLAGLVGAGHDEAPYLISGARPGTGTVHVDGEELSALPFRERLARGVVLIPGNRQRDGLWMAARAWENITLSHLNSYRRLWGLQLKAERRQSRQLMERLGVRPPEPDRLAGQFSGGNQQKIVLAKWLYRPPNVLLLDEPTQGIDAGAKREILDLIVDLATQGTTVLMASGDYEQLANVCHRVLVLRDGELVAELTGDEVSEFRITEAAQGGEQQGLEALPHAEH